MMDIDQFVKDRDEALLSLNAEKIIAYAQKWGAQKLAETPPNALLFWVTVHKARTGCISLPMEARIISKQWLMNRGYQSMDDGDIPTERT